MTTEERAHNLARIAEAAVAIERTHGIPAELASGQCIIESSWLAKSPGNNCFGLKAPANATHYQTLETLERLTDAQLEHFLRAGRKVVTMGEVGANGKRTVKLLDRFQVFADLTECFEAYADLLLNGKYFKARLERFAQHRDVVQLLTDMSGADGQPPYYTGAGYVDLWCQIVNQQNVKAALAEARQEKTS